MPYYFIAVIALVLSAGMTTASTVTSTTITPADDRTIGNISLTERLGPQGDQFLRVGFNDTYWRAAIEFDISGIPTGQTIDSATLNIRGSGVTSSVQVGTMNAYGYLGNGTIEVADSTATNNFLESFEIVQTNNSALDISLNVTPFLASIYSNDADYMGILLTAATPTGLDGGAADICSSEGPAEFPSRCSGGAPELVVSYSAAPIAPVPLPSGFPLLLAGLVGMGAWARRKKVA